MSEIDAKAGKSRNGAARVRIEDIAEELGVSRTAVSFAINDRPGVSAETKRRVMEAADRMGWHRVYAAQALGSSRTMTAGFAPSRSFNELDDESFMLHFISGLHEGLCARRYGLLYRPCLTMEEEMKVYEDWASHKRVDGVVLINPCDDDPRPALLKELDVPAVIAGRAPGEPPLPSIGIDDSTAMTMILDHLYLHGHRCVAYISGNESLNYSKERVETFNRYLREHRMEHGYVEFSDYDAERAAHSTMRILTTGAPAPTAFIYETELLAATSLRTLSKAILDKNSDAPCRDYVRMLPAIVSFEDSFVCESTFPSITAVRRDARAYGERVAGGLLDVFDGKPVPDDQKAVHLQLIERESTRGYVRAL